MRAIYFGERQVPVLVNRVSGERGETKKRIRPKPAPQSLFPQDAAASKDPRKRSPNWLLLLGRRVGAENVPPSKMLHVFAPERERERE